MGGTRTGWIGPVVAAAQAIVQKRLKFDDVYLEKVWPENRFGPPPTSRSLLP